MLESAGLKNCKEVQSALNKLYKDEHADLRQDANCVLHVLNDCLDMVDAINTKREYAEEELERIQRDVYLVAMLQSQKLIVHGEAVMEGRGHQQGTSYFQYLFQELLPSDQQTYHTVAGNKRTAVQPVG